jgi:transposase
MKNRYIRRGHLPESAFKLIIKAFSNDLNALETASWTGVNRNTVNRLFGLLRVRIAKISLEESATLGIFEVDESYFGAKRVRGKRGRGAAGKTPVFGLLKRDGKVFITVVENCSKEQLLPIIQGKVLEGSTIHSDGWKAYDGLILNGYQHYRVYHSHNEFARGKCHVNGIEAFWSYAKRRLARRNGFSTSDLSVHLKETEFRYNNRSNNLYPIMIASLKNNPL